MNALRSHNAHRVFSALALGDLTVMQLMQMLGLPATSVEYALTALGKRGMAMRSGYARKRARTTPGPLPYQWRRSDGESECRYRPEGVGKLDERFSS